MVCVAYQASDEMKCPCGLTWDVNDPDPPRCRRQRHVEPGRVPAQVRRAIEVERRVSPPGAAFLPAELPLDVALEMVNAARAARQGLAGDVAAMRAAYRVLLDRLGE
jgi:hypothetical protein